MGKCNITDQELAEALDITLDKLYDICDIFDADPNDEWELKEGIHFKKAPHQARSFSPEGAVEICNYLEENHQERPVFNRFKRWMLRRDRRLKGLMVTKKVTESVEVEGQLIFVNNRAFLGPRACRSILQLGTRQDVLNRTFQQIQRSENTEIEPMQLGSDFYDDSEQLFLSRSGIAVVGKHLGTTLSQKHRQEWSKVVAEYAPKAIESIEKCEAEKQKRIQAAMNRVRKQAKSTCQITDRKCKIHKINLEIHHLYDKNKYPNLADIDANLIAIDGNIHKHFHQWMGGTDKSCTIADMEKYIEEFGDSLFQDNVGLAADVALKLSQLRRAIST